jgi:hypothetical protein
MPKSQPIKIASDFGNRGPVKLDKNKKAKHF